jgi:3'-phosphoadenosine 5'-phosphosulfate sulfotransferase (PAPS reductase)/FAD synthetase
MGAVELAGGGRKEGMAKRTWREEAAAVWVRAALAGERGREESARKNEPFFLIDDISG